MGLPCNVLGLVVEVLKSSGCAQRPIGPGQVLVFVILALHRRAFFECRPQCLRFLVIQLSAELVLVALVVVGGQLVHLRLVRLLNAQLLLQTLALLIAKPHTGQVVVQPLPGAGELAFEVLIERRELFPSLQPLLAQRVFGFERSVAFQLGGDQLLVRQQRLLVGGEGFLALDVRQLLLELHQLFGVRAQGLACRTLVTDQSVLLL